MVAIVGAALSVVARPRLAPICVGGLVAWIIGGPVVVVAVGAALGGVMMWRRAKAERDLTTSATKEQLLALDLVALAVAGGLTFPQAMQLVRGSVDETMRREIARLERHHAVGTLADTRFPMVAAMFSAARRSEATGAALAPELAALSTSIRRDGAAKAHEKIGRLPVVLLFPLALMILPGFVLMTVGPTVISGLSRLGL